MAEQREKSIVRQQPDASAEAETGHNIEDFGDLLEELRLLLQGTQVLAAFLILLPFNQGFRQIDQSEKWLYLATFVCSIISLILFSAPAAQHQLRRPLADRVGFKIYATRMAIAGMFFFSLSLTAATFLVVSEVEGLLTGAITASVVALLILVNWWMKVISRFLTPKPEIDRD